MGGCATKPKANTGEAPPPEPAPESTENSAPGAAADLKEALVVLDKAKEIVVEDDAVDEHSNRRRSLSNLFKENNEGKESTKLEKSTVDPVKQEEPSADKKFAEVSEAKPYDHESAKIATPVEQTLKEVEEAPLEANAEKVIEVAPTTGTLADEAIIESPAIVEMQNREKKLEEEKLAVETEQTPEDKKPAVVTQKPETPEEQKAVVEATLIEKP